MFDQGGVRFHTHPRVHSTRVRTVCLCSYTLFLFPCFTDTRTNSDTTHHTQVLTHTHAQCTHTYVLMHTHTHTHTHTRARARAWLYNIAYVIFLLLSLSLSLPPLFLSRKTTKQQVTDSWGIIFRSGRPRFIKSGNCLILVWLIFTSYSIAMITVGWLSLRNTVVVSTCLFVLFVF